MPSAAEPVVVVVSPSSPPLPPEPDEPQAVSVRAASNNATEAIRASSIREGRAKDFLPAVRRLTIGPPSI